MNWKLKSLLTFCLFFLAIGSARASTERPNIIVIFTDDLGYNDIGFNTYPSREVSYPEVGPKPAYGLPKERLEKYNFPEPNEARLLTPRIDQMAEEGFVMNSFYSSSICSPSRASLMTGRYDKRMNLTNVFFPDSEDGLSTEEVTLPEKLREAGYVTNMIGKWHLGWNKDMPNPFQLMPTRNGFQHFYGVPYSNDMRGYRMINDEEVLEDVGPADKQAELTWRFTEKALQVIEEGAADDRPFFLYFAHAMTHIPCWPSDREFKNADGTTWPVFKGSSGVSYFYDIIKEVDYSTGRILDKLDALGIDDETLVIFTSDNGPWLWFHDDVNEEENSVGSAYPFKNSKFSNNEGGVRVPFIVRWKGEIPGGKVNHSVGALIDLLPTLVGVGGGQLPSDRTVDGVNLWSLWSGEVNEIERTYAYHSSKREGDLEGVRRGNYKLYKDKLFKLDEDPQEMSDLSKQPAYSEPLAFLESEAVRITASIEEENAPRGGYTPFEVQISDNDLKIAENSKQSLKIRLSHNPGRAVSVQTSFFSGDTSFEIVKGGLCAFDSGNWSDWQELTIRSKDYNLKTDVGATFRMTIPSLSVVRELFVVKSK